MKRESVLGGLRDPRLTAMWSNIILILSWSKLIRQKLRKPLKSDNAIGLKACTKLGYVTYNVNYQQG